MNNSTSSPIAIANINIASKSVDLLVISKSIIYKINEYPYLSLDIAKQKQWINNLLSSTIVGREISVVLGCFLASVIAFEII